MELSFGFIVAAGISVLTVMYILFIAASVTREEISIHDLRVNTHRLRNAYAKKMAALRGEGGDEEIINVDIVSEDDDIPEASLAAENASAAQAA